MIKAFMFVLLMASALSGADKSSQLFVRFEGEPLLAHKILQQTLSSMGNQSDIRRFTSDGSVCEVQMNIGGKRGYDSRRFVELLKEHAVTVLVSKFENQQWLLDLDMREAVLNIPKINEDSSAQMQRSVYPYWLDVSQARYITIDAPYEGVWYPEIAVLDGTMQVLHSSKESQSQERMAFELPEGSKYLKVSNSYGMHLMKEGLWVLAEQNDN